MSAIEGRKTSVFDQVSGRAVTRQLDRIVKSAPFARRLFKYLQGR